MYVSTDSKGSNFRFHGDFDLGLTVVAWPIEVTKKNGNAAHLDARHPCFRALFRFPRNLLRPDRAGRSTGRLQHTPDTRPLGLELYFLILDPGVPETTPDYFKIGHFASRSIQKVYMLISWDRTPTGPHLNCWKMLKNHQNRNTFDTFRNFYAMAPPATSQNDQQRAKYSFFSGNFNCPSNYAFPELNPYRPVKMNFWNSPNM